VAQSYVITDRVSVTLWKAATAFSKIKNRAFQKRTSVSSPIILAPIAIPKTREEEVLTTQTIFYQSALQTETKGPYYQRKEKSYCQIPKEFLTFPNKSA
jgi:hypothetical protein